MAAPSSSLTWTAVGAQLDEVTRSAIELYASGMQLAEANAHTFNEADTRPVRCQKAMRVAAIAYTAQLLRSMRMRGEEGDLRDQAVDMLRQLAAAEQEGV